MNVQIFEVEEVAGKQYVTTVARGVEYTLAPHGDGWGVATRRLALGRFNTGGFRFFDSLADVGTKCAAFADFFACGVKA